MFENQLNNVGTNQINSRANDVQIGMDGSVQSDGISLRDLFEIVMRSKWWVLGSILLAGLMAFVITKSLPKKYQTYATVLLNESQGTQSEGTGLDALVNLGMSAKNVDNEVQLIKSAFLSKRVVHTLQGKGYADLPVLYDQEGKRLKVDDVASAIRGMTEVTVTPQTSLIQIATKSTSPKEAQLIANLYAEEYLKWRLQSTRESATASRKFLEQQADTLSSVLRNNEQYLEDYSNQQALIAPDEEGRLLVQQIADIENEKGRAAVDMGMASAKLRSLQVQLDRASPGLEKRINSTSEAEIGIYKQKIALLQSEIQEMYIANPQLRGRERENAGIQEKIDNLNSYTRKLRDTADGYLDDNINAVGGGTSGDATGIRGQLDYINMLRGQILNTEVELSGINARNQVLGERLGQLQSKYSALPTQVISLEKLKRNRDASVELSKYVNDKLNEARIFEKSKVGNLEVIDAAAYPLAPFFPRPMVNLGLGLVLGLVLGCAIAFFRNAVDQKIRKPEDLRKKGFSVLGVIPTMEDIIKREFKGRDKVTFDGQTMSTALSTLLSPLAPASEAYRRLRANIDFSRLDKQLQTMVITSAAPGEGKSITAMNLAIAMAQSGRKTIYVDADLRRPSGHKMLEMNKEPGLVDTLFETNMVNWEQFSTRIDDLYVMPAGSSVPNPAELMGAKKMRELILQLRNEFDVVIFDTPPVLSVTDGLLLSSLVDACIVVISASETTWQGIDRTMDVLKGVGANVAGIVLNRFDPTAAYGYTDYYNSYGYSSYKRYYYDEAVKETKSKPKK